jgi:hypothetical protein
MPSTPSLHRSLVAVSLLALASALCTSAFAAPDAQAAYQKQVALCNSGQPGEDKATCLKEAGAALAQAKKGGPSEASPDTGLYRENALKRCRALPEADQKDCVARIDDGTKSGSVAGGGVIRELRTTQVGPAASAASVTSP